jgi:lysyl-tRNA synthetase class 2
VGVVALDAVASSLAHFAGHRAPGPGAGHELPPETHVAALLTGLMLLVLVPRLWRGTRTAAGLATAGVATLVFLSLLGGYEVAAIVQLSLCGLLVWARASFHLGCRNRPRLAVVVAALGAWLLAYATLRLAPLAHAHTAHLLARVLGHTHDHRSARAGMSADWLSLVEVLIGSAALISVLAMRSMLRPRPAENGHSDSERRAAKAIVDEHGKDSLSPFLLRPDKALKFGAGGVLSYRVLRGTAVVSADPVAPPGAAAAVLEEFLPEAHAQGWQVVLWGASATHLTEYRRLGLRNLRVGEEAFVDPHDFSLEGRSVRKLRQSVHRMARRGWEVSVVEGRQIDEHLEHEIGELEARWREGQNQLLGFAMGMGSYETEVGPDDLYALARSPDGELGAVMHFVSHCGQLSLDTMRRVGSTPNGLNEALVCQTLAEARERELHQVSLNYAGLAHLLRGERRRRGLGRVSRILLTAPLRHHFQMDRLVRFNDKFSPEWRPRYLVYESRTALPWAVLRVLQAEGYLPQPMGLRLPELTSSLPRVLARLTQAKSTS